MTEKKTWNAQITKASLTMESHGCLTIYLTLQGSGRGVQFGGHNLGRGYKGAKTFTGSAKGTEYIMRIMDVVGVSRFEDLEGKYVRVVETDGDSVVKEIGNIVANKWFNVEDFYRKEDEKHD